MTRPAPYWIALSWGSRLSCGAGLAAAAAQRKATAAQLKLAALLALAGREPAKAVEDAGYAARHPSVRQLLPVVDTLGELKSLVQAQRFAARVRRPVCRAITPV